MLFVMEDGSVLGEILTKAGRRDLPRDFKVSNPSRFFDIPLNLRQHQLEVSPHCEEIIVALEEPSGHQVCTFLMSQLPSVSPARYALDDLVQKIKEITEQDIAGNSPRVNT
jgi:hypothetical protein